MSQNNFPPGTPVRIRQTSMRRGKPLESVTVGVVESWEEQPTGSWYADGKDDKLWLTRLQLRKIDGEIVCLVIDAGTYIARIEAATPKP